MLPRSAGHWHALPWAQAHGRSARWPLHARLGLWGRLHSPRAGLPSLSPDHGWPSDGFSFSAVLSGKSGTSLPLQLSVSTRAGAAPAPQRPGAWGAPSWGPSWFLWRQQTLGASAVSWVLGGGSQKLSLLFQGAGDSWGVREDTPGFREQLAGGKAPCEGASASSPQGERGLRPCGGASAAHRPARRGRHPLRELQDHARVEIRESLGPAGRKQAGCRPSSRGRGLSAWGGCARRAGDHWLGAVTRTADSSGVLSPHPRTLLGPSRGAGEVPGRRAPFPSAPHPAPSSFPPLVTPSPRKEAPARRPF